MRVQVGGFLCALYIMLKVTGTLATWSWWWVLLPIVPDLAWVCEKAGWL